MNYDDFNPLTELNIDPAHEEMDLFNQELTKDIWEEKYRWPKGHEESPQQTFQRVAKGVYRDDTKEAKYAAYTAMEQGLWCPGGRIIAGCGTDKVVTQINCYVIRDIPDSMQGISAALQDSMLTMQQGGGIGLDFSTLRPSGAYLQRTQAVASGPLPFMDMWSSMCQTIMSAGSRRGAMMAVMNCEHPDLPAFITAKHTQGRLTSFNVSVLVTDAFMEAVAQDEDWYLGFNQPRADGEHLFEDEREDVEGTWYAYSKWKARDLWDLIMESTYEYSEPGVIFIDRVNDQNNLKYTEVIHATNPCGEQPLPPNGCCNLGAVNLARMVRKPFTAGAKFDFALLRKVVRIGVRFLDNVADVANYPLATQREEEELKRRIGLGITGLADALMQLQVEYGTERSLFIAENIMKTIRDTAYDESAELAKERGPFPLYKEEWGQGNPVVEGLPDKVKAKIKEHGIRNGVILTIAPTGTTSILFGNVSSGLEPVFAHFYKRKVLQADGSHREYIASGYGYRMYQNLVGGDEVTLPTYMSTAEVLSVDSHVRMQGVCQRYVDASISKTINLPKDITYEEFKLVYWDTYSLGCKGCTTYRPSEVRGSVLSTLEEDAKSQGHAQPALRERPDVLTGRTYKLTWPHSKSAYYVTINNDEEGTPFEIFITSTNSKHQDWTTALSLMISAIMRKESSGGDLSFVPDELEKVMSTTDVAWVKGKFYGSLVAMIGETIRLHIEGSSSSSSSSDRDRTTHVSHIHGGGGDEGSHSFTPHTHIDPKTVCDACGMPTLKKDGGCMTCTNCHVKSCS